MLLWGKSNDLMKKLMLGFAGEMAAGKGTATEFVKTWYPGTPSFRFSDSLREFHAWLGAEFLVPHGVTIPANASTKDLQGLSTKIRELFGENSLERAVALRADRCLSESPIVIIEGIRRPVDISTLMTDSRYNFKLIYIEADIKIRWMRHRARNEKPGDAELSFAQFVELGKAEPEAQIRLLKPHAHLVFINNGRSTARLECAMSRTFSSLILST
jgi:dephospho-CoA kinase